ncbi:MAG: DUF5103 domain-containing protein [Bacteroidales bacterium]|jgi:hypothetical protein|nr:DUF5103 domain-containing protein [Bacteroidales bacterium]
MNIALIYQHITNFFFISFPSILLSVFPVFTASAQSSRVYFQRSDVCSIELFRSGQERSLPAVNLGSGESLILSFDIMDSDRKTLYFNFTHCNFDWLPSDLLPVEYFAGFNKEFGYEQSEFSTNTTADYIHYQINIPTGAITHSGNYLISVYDENGSLILSRPMWVIEPLANISTRIIRNTYNHIATHSLDLMVRCPNIKVDVPSRQMHIAAWKDDDIDDAIITCEPSFIRNEELSYINIFHFPAGNEYLWADTRSIRATRVGVRRIDFIDPMYHVTLETDRKPLSYSYHEEFNGKFYIENVDLPNADAATQSDYVMVHFSLAVPDDLPADINPADFPIYVYGQLTNYSIEPRYRMTYDSERDLYSLDLRLKQGFYNYDYVTMRKNHIEPLASFTDTESDYHIAVYFRDFAGTADRLVGVYTHNSLHSHNSFIR